MFKILLFVLFCSSGLAETIPLDTNFLSALRKTETGGQKNFGIGSIGKNGELGPYQITKAYWLDAKKFDKTLTGSFQNCSTKEYSEKVITAYLNHYAPAACVEKNYPWLAEIHNCGPRKRWETSKYWDRFRGYLTEGNK